MPFARSQRDPKYGVWVVNEPDNGLEAWSKRERKRNKAFSRSFRFIYFKYRGGHRIRYAYEPISRLLLVFDLILLAYTYSASNLQSFVASAWAFAQFMFTMIALPYNRCGCASGRPFSTTLVLRDSRHQHVTIAHSQLHVHR